MALQDPIKSTTFVTNTEVQKTFVGGVDTISGDTQIPENAYLWLINGRPRFGYIDPIKKHVEITDLPAGKKQGCIGVGDVLVVFVAGKAYYHVEGTFGWQEVAGFQMSATANRYWSCAVPASSLNFQRKSQENISDPIKLSMNFKIAGTPAAIVVQDGESQPYVIINNDGAFWARELGTFNSWKNISATAEDREYVPIGKQMILFNGNTLFIVALNGQSVYRSVTGRPLDFMINVDTDGNKAVDENAGGVTTTSFAFDYDRITCLANINIPDSFIYATDNTVRIITADFTNTIFGEPTFRVSAQILAGIVNERSFVEILGDYAFIDHEGIISFNAVQQLKFNGRNSIFSLAVSKLLKNTKQTRCICVNYDNYSIFNIDSIWGNIMAVYDNLLQKWVSFDITNVIKIKEFAVVETTSSTKLYCITEYNELFDMFSSPTDTYLTQIKTRSFVAGETDTELRCQHFRPFFNSGTRDGSVTVIEYADEKTINDKQTGLPINYVTKELTAAVAGILYPVRPPVVPNNTSRSDSPSFNFSQGLIGKKLSYIIQWNNDAKLIEFQTIVSWKKSTSSLKESNKVLQNAYANG